MTQTKETDIKHEGKHFFVILNRALKRFEVCKIGLTHSVVVGWGNDLAKCIRTANRLELYPNNV